MRRHPARCLLADLLQARGAWIGFNLGFAVGALFLGVLSFLVTHRDYDLVRRIPGLRTLTIAVSVSYVLIALRFWFYAPVVAATTGAVCFIASAWVGRARDTTDIPNRS